MPVIGLNMDKKDKVLITGAGGMVGRTVAEKFTHAGYRRVLTPNSKELDLLRQDRVENYFKKHKPAVVVHLAARVGGILANTRFPADYLHDNLVMTLNVLGSARKNGVRKLLNLGSSCVYPTHCKQPMKEEYLLTGKLEPTNEGYALAKIAALKLCEYENKQYGTNFISLMPPNIYGPGDHFEPLHSHVVSALILKFHEAKVRKKPSVEVWGTGKARREFLYVEDVADAILYFMTRYDAKDLPAFLNVGPGDDVSVKELARLIQGITGYQGRVLFDRSKPDGMLRKCMDVSLAKKFGWKAKTPLRTGLVKTYEWYLKRAR
jgi:GDP-L-fucose synthase